MALCSVSGCCTVMDIDGSDRRPKLCLQLPSKQDTKQTWLEVLNDCNIIPTDSNTVWICYMHYREVNCKINDLPILVIEENKTIRNNLHPVSTTYNDPTNEIQYTLTCHTCLAQTATLLSPSLAAAFTQTTGVSVAEARLPCALCATCAAYLHKAARFREASARADLVLRDLASRGMLNKQSIQSAQTEIVKPLTTLTTRNVFEDNFIPLPTITGALCSDPIKIEPEESNSKYSEIEEVSIDCKTENLPPFIPEDDNIDNIDNIDFEDIDTKKEEENQKQNKEKVKFEKVKTSKSAKKRKCPLNSIKSERKVLISDNSDSDNETIASKRSCVRKRSVKSKSVQKKDEDRFKEIFTIEALSVEQQKVQFSKRKKSENYKKAKFKCNFCFRGFLSDKSYNVHMKRHSEKLDDTSCPVCYKHLPSKNSLAVHTYNLHKYNYKCNKCDYTTSSRASANLHTNLHNGQQYSCEQCDGIFATQASLETHVRKKHASDHPCPLCGYDFLGENGLKSHRALKHKNEEWNVGGGAPSCAECDITFCNEDALNTHRRVSPKHGGRREKPKRKDVGFPKCSPLRYTCDLCGRQFRRKSRLKEHIEKHMGKKYLCPICGKTFTDATNVYRHRNNVHGEKPKPEVPKVQPVQLCSVCGKSFRSSSGLQYHMQKHFQLNYLTCNLCGKQILGKYRLQLHMEKHMGKKYFCSICGKSFGDKGNMSRHKVNVHLTTEKNFKCQDCDKRYKTAEDLRYHINHVHLSMPYPQRVRNRRKDSYLAPNQ